jgi:cob(I)alamin adenosyltransferase
MGNRLSKIVTRTGDGGETGLATGDRIRKSHQRVDAIGEVDELNCCIGLMLAVALPKAVHDAVAPAQDELFDLGGELAMPEAVVITDEYLARLDAAIAELNAELPPLKEFVLPGGNEAAARAHLARAVARRCERALWRLSESDSVNPNALRYLNRLSDMLFVCARLCARVDGQTEVSWRKSSARSPKAD